MNYGSRKFVLTIYSVVLCPALLALGLIAPEHFVTLYGTTLGLYYGANVFQKRGDRGPPYILIPYPSAAKLFGAELAAGMVDTPL